MHIEKGRTSYLGFGYETKFSKPIHLLFRAGYKNTGYQLWNENYIVDEFNDNSFVQKKMATNAREIGSPIMNRYYRLEGVLAQSVNSNEAFAARIDQKVN